MQRRILFLLSVLLMIAVATPAPAEPKPVDKKKSTTHITSKTKDVKRAPVQSRERAQAPVAPRYERKAEPEKRPAPKGDYRQPRAEVKERKAPKPQSVVRERESVKPRSEQRPKQQMDSRDKRPVRGAPEKNFRPERQVPADRWEKRPTDKNYRVRENVRPEDLPKVNTRPMPTFLKDRAPDDLKQKLPKTKLSGTVEKIEGEKAFIRTPDGRRAQVHIGPKSYLRKKGYDLEPGQEVTVDGWGEWHGDNAEADGFFFAGGIWGPGFHFEFANYDGYPYWADPADYWDGWYPSWDVYYVYFWGPPPWWAYAPPPSWYYYGPPPRWWYYRNLYAPPPHWRHHCHRW